MGHIHDGCERNNLSSSDEVSPTYFDNGALLLINFPDASKLNAESRSPGGVDISFVNNLSSEFSINPIRKVDSVNKMKNELYFLEKMLFHREGEYNWYKKAVNLIGNEINKLSSKISFGACHGDFHLYNAFFISLIKRFMFNDSIFRLMYIFANLFTM